MLTLLMYYFIFYSRRALFLVVIFLVSLNVFTFSKWYTTADLARKRFRLIYGRFLLFMLVMLHGLSWYLFFTGWEMMRVFSFLLIAWFSGRSMAGNGSCLAFLSNRFRDLLLFRGILNGCSLFLCFAGGLTKSAIWLFSSWLPNAMERPTPVSTLLHSSTMVVARVFLIGILNYCSFFFCLLFLLYRRYVRRVRRQFSDYKWIIAYSTSSQLALVRLIVILGSEIGSLSYIEVHAFFKSLLFMLCGWLIHSNYIQHVDSRYNFYIIGGLVFFCCCVMCGLPFFSVSRIKDVILIRLFFFSFYVFFITYAYWTIIYSILLSSPVSWESMIFYEGGHIFFIYLFYFPLSFYLCESFGLGLEFRRTMVLGLMFLPLLYLCCSFFLVHSVDLNYKFKLSGSRLYLFGSLLKSFNLLKSGFLIVFIFLLIF